jgi:hypothetical protein
MILDHWLPFGTKSAWNLPKNHCLTHVFRNVLEHGGRECTGTHGAERHNKDTKSNFANFTSKAKDSSKQLLKAAGFPVVTPVGETKKVLSFVFVSSLYQLLPLKGNNAP